MIIKSEVIAGLILSGGESSRMGIAKHTLVYHQQPQILHLTTLLKEFLSEVYISGNTEHPTDKKTKTIPDQFDFKGPLNGILSALTAIKNKALLVIPSDMPAIDHNTIQLLISKRNPEKYATCFFNQAIPGPEPLFAIWEPGAEKIMHDYMLDGNRSVKGLIKEINIELINPDNENIFTNINTPEEYQLWLKNKPNQNN